VTVRLDRISAACIQCYRGYLSKEWNRLRCYIHASSTRTAAAIKPRAQWRLRSIFAVV